MPKTPRRHYIRRPVELKRKILDDFNSGIPALELEKKYDINRVQIYYWKKLLETTGSLERKKSKIKNEQEEGYLEKSINVVNIEPEEIIKHTYGKGLDEVMQTIESYKHSSFSIKGTRDNNILHLLAHEDILGKIFDNTDPIFLAEHIHGIANKFAYRENFIDIFAKNSNKRSPRQVAQDNAYNGSKLSSNVAEALSDVEVKVVSSYLVQLENQRKTYFNDHRTENILTLELSCKEVPAQIELFIDVILESLEERNQIDFEVKYCANKITLSGHSISMLKDYSFADNYDDFLDLAANLCAEVQ